MYRQIVFLSPKGGGKYDRFRAVSNSLLVTRLARFKQHIFDKNLILKRIQFPDD